MNIQYEFQHQLLPNWAYNSSPFFNDLINIGEKQTLYKAARKHYENRSEEFPFTEDDFGGFHVRLDVDTVVVLLRFPEPKEVPMCFCSFIYLDTKTNQIAYYTLEKGKDPTNDKDMQFLCGWDAKGQHQQYGSVYTEQHQLGDIFLIRFFYMVFRGLKGAYIPDQPKTESEKTRVLKCPACHSEIIFDASEIKEGDRFLVLCSNCLRIYQLRYENNDFLIENRIKEDNNEG